MENIKTLEDLRIFLQEEFRNKFEDKLKVGKSEEDYLNVIKYMNSIIDRYDLSSEQKDYVKPFGINLEEASHIKTIVNTKSAQNILIKLKYKLNK